MLAIKVPKCPTLTNKAEKMMEAVVTVVTERKQGAQNGTVSQLWSRCCEL